jgi:hypothetical protein
MVRIVGVGVRNEDALALGRTARLRLKPPGLATSDGIKRPIAGFATGNMYLGLCCFRKVGLGRREGTRREVWLDVEARRI